MQKMNLYMILFISFFIRAASVQKKDKKEGFACLRIEQINKEIEETQKSLQSNIDARNDSHEEIDKVFYNVYILRDGNRIKALKDELSELKSQNR